MTWSNGERGAAAERYADRRVFVAVAADRDGGVADTVREALRAAARPARVRLGIGLVFDDETVSVLDPWADDPRVAVDRVPFGEDGGIGWLRARAAGLFDGEPYVVQIGARARFADRWDERLIAMLEATGHDRPVITGHAPASGPPPGDTAPPDAGPAPTDVLGRPTELWGDLLVARGRFLRDVPPDPDIADEAQDPTLTVRAYTHGYDLFWPTEDVVRRLAAPGSSPRPHRPGGEGDGAARRRAARLLDGDDRGMGHHGLGRVRSIRARAGLLGRA